MTISWNKITGVAIAGPTASGKSALALALARELDGVVINADSMQVYSDLRVVTARPGVEEEGEAPHALYGYIDAADACSAARWAADAKAAIVDARARGQVPVLVGGTGLYFRSLFTGLAPLPPVDGGVRAHWRALGLAAPSTEMHRMLAERDPVMAARLHPSDTQRIIRALEVVESTGRSLATWQAERTDPLLSSDGWRKVALTPEREWLHERLTRRFAAMMGEGAVEEVQALLARGLDPALPCMKAIGVAEIGAMLAGEIGRDEAVAQAVQATKRYVKRQETWQRGQMGADWQRLDVGHDAALTPARLFM